jgi:hypothetical protein
MDTLLRVVAALIGLMLIFAFLRSASRVALVNRPRGDWFARGIGWLVHSTLGRLARTQPTYDDVQDVLAWVLPLYILFVITAWFGLVLAGFALLIWSFQAEHSLLKSIIASGSQLSTLGFPAPPDTAGQLLAILEGAMGLGVVVFYFTFVPGYQTTIQLRQVKVAWLYARASAGLTNFTLLEWFLGTGGSDWNGLWEDWESWFRNIGESHGLAPVLAFVPTVHRGQTWLAAAAVALESVSLYLSAIEAQGALSAAVCHRTGVDALCLVAAPFADRNAASELQGRIRLSRSDFDLACDRFAALGAKVRTDRESRWLRFVAYRQEYEALLQRLAETLLVPATDDLLSRLTDRGRPRHNKPQLN